MKTLLKKIAFMSLIGGLTMAGVTQGAAKYECMHAMDDYPSGEFVEVDESQFNYDFDLMKGEADSLCKAKGFDMAADTDLRYEVRNRKTFNLHKYKNV